MVGKKFLIFLHAGKGNRKGERSLQLCITFINRTFRPNEAIASIAQSAERQTMDLRFSGTNPALHSFFFFCVELFYNVCMHTKCIHNGAKPFKKSHLNLQKKSARSRIQFSVVFSTGGTSAIAPVILRKRLIAPVIFLPVFRNSDKVLPRIVLDF